MGTIEYRVPTAEEIAGVIAGVVGDTDQQTAEDFVNAGTKLLERYIIQERVKDRKPIQTAKDGDKVAE